MINLRLVLSGVILLSACSSSATEQSLGIYTSSDDVRVMSVIAVPIGQPLPTAIPSGAVIYKIKPKPEKRPLIEPDYVIPQISPAELNNIPTFARDYVLRSLSELLFFSGGLDEWGQSFANGASKPVWQSQKPWWVTLDFNGDATTDWIGFLVRRDEDHYSGRVWHTLQLTCVCSSADGYKHLIAKRDAGTAEPGYTHYGVYPAGRGQFVSQVDGQEDVFAHFDSVTYLNHEKGGGIYYWDGQEVQFIATSD